MACAGIPAPSQFPKRLSSCKNWGFFISAAVAQWIEPRISNPMMRVRFPPTVPNFRYLSAVANDSQRHQGFGSHDRDPFFALVAQTVRAVGEDMDTQCGRRFESDRVRHL